MRLSGKTLCYPCAKKGLLVDSSHIPKLLKTSDIVYIFQAKYYMIFYNTENENNTKI